MILSFECENHKSIKEKVVFTALATTDKSKQSNLISYNDRQVLRTMAIYGANGSGKSNFIHALDFTKALVLNSINHQPGQGVFQAPHKLSSPDSVSRYTIVFVKDGAKYEFSFSVQQNRIVEEHLYYYPNNRRAVIFTRDESGVTSGRKYKGAFSTATDLLRDNRLFLSCIANYSNVPEVEAAFMFFKNDLVIYNANANNWIEYSVDVLQNNMKTRESFLQILRALGTGIQDIKVKLEKKMLKADELPFDMPDFLKPLMTKEEANVMTAKIVYKDFETDLMAEESAGIKKLFELVCPIMDVLMNNKTLVCDEIEDGLHEALVMEIIKSFNGLVDNSTAQLIFSTHNTGILDRDIFRRDQIWFTEMDINRSTTLYPLSSCRNVRKTEDMVTNYINGKYGAIPVLNSSLVDYINSMK